MLRDILAATLIIVFSFIIGVLVAEHFSITSHVEVEPSLSNVSTADMVYTIPPSSKADVSVDFLIPQVFEIKITPAQP